MEVIFHIFKVQKRYKCFCFIYIVFHGCYLSSFQNCQHSLKLFHHLSGVDAEDIWNVVGVVGGHRGYVVGELKFKANSAHVKLEL
jgi:hypothetical protein